MEAVSSESQFDKNKHWICRINLVFIHGTNSMSWFCRDNNSNNNNNNNNRNQSIDLQRKSMDLSLQWNLQKADTIGAKKVSALKRCPLYRGFFQESLATKQSDPFLDILSVLQRCWLYRDCTVYDKGLRHKRGKLIGILYGNSSRKGFIQVLSPVLSEAKQTCTKAQQTPKIL